MDSDVRLEFFPKSETIFFFIAATATIILGYFISLTVWLIIPILALEYLVILGGASTVRVSEGTLTVTSMNPFLGSWSAELPSIVRIKMLDKIERQADVDFGGYFLLYSRRVQIIFADEHQQKFAGFFSILNKKEEKRVLKALRKMTKKEKPQQLSEPEEDPGPEEQEES